MPSDYIGVVRSLSVYDLNSTHLDWVESTNEIQRIVDVIKANVFSEKEKNVLII